MSSEFIPNLITSYFSSLQAMNAAAGAANFTEDAVIYTLIG